jgi:hypothetical protein
MRGLDDDRWSAEGPYREDDPIDPFFASPETIVTEFVSLLLVIVGFAYLFIAAAKLGAGPQDAFDAIFASPMPPARPRGVQENDLPRFAV